MIGTCKLNNKSMRAIRRSQEYQCLAIDLALLGVISEEQCEVLIGGGVPSGLVLPNGTSALNVVPSNDGTDTGTDTGSEGTGTGTGTGSEGTGSEGTGTGTDTGTDTGSEGTGTGTGTGTGSDDPSDPLDPNAGRGDTDPVITDPDTGK